MSGTINGEKIAENIEAELQEAEENPRLEIILVGDDPASETFVEEKLESAERIGFEANLKEFSNEIETQKLLEYIENLNEKDVVHGVLIQLPLPEHIDNHTVFDKLSPEKDVDGLTPQNMGKFLRGNPEIKPAAVEGIETIIEHENIVLKGQDAVIINNSNLMGKPLSMVLTQKGATVTLCHEKTEDLEKYTSEADIVVTATGEPGVLTPEMVPEDCLVIDAGYEHGDGDIRQKEEFSEKANLSPVPSGLGPITVAETMRNLLKCYRNQN